MQYHNKIKNLSKVQKMVFISILVAFALVLSYFETFLPILPYPGVKLGLANIVTLTSLYILGFGDALILVLLRVTLNSFFAGSLITFWYSLSGGLLSFIVMYLLIYVGKDRISTIGISILGAISHNIGQLIVVVITIENINIIVAYFPILAIAGIIAGILIGVTVNYLLPYINKIFK